MSCFWDYNCGTLSLWMNNAIFKSCHAAVSANNLFCGVALKYMKDAIVRKVQLTLCSFC